MKFNQHFFDFDTLHGLEWIETNGLGGYASGTFSGAHSRRYHGLLVVATQPPVGRMSLLSKLDETIVTDKDKYELGTNQYPGALHPRGYSFLKKIERELSPVFYYKAESIEIKKTIAAIHGEHTTVILYEVLEGPSAFELELLPLYASRDFHSLTRANDYISQQYLFDEGVFRTLNYQGCPELFISVPRAKFTESQGWYYNFEYSVEQERGLEYKEDLYTHGKFSVELKKGDKLGIIVSTEDPTGRDAFKLFEKEMKRRVKITHAVPESESLKRLALAAEQFIVKRGKFNSIIAGYHWFADWGRDTMIALPGLCLATGRHDEAKRILLQFSKTISQGMLPNRFPDRGEVPEYNTIDATLWFFVAIYHYYQHTRDKVFMKQLLPALKDIVEWHYKGTRYNIRVDEKDELLYGGKVGVQLTWMDAKVGDWVVTPRRGKAVEINALWYNALCIMGMLCEETNNIAEGKIYRTRASKVLKSFNELFWNENQNSLYDYIDSENKNDDLRPNQMYAISLPFPLLDKDRATKIFTTVTTHLFTPKGLRSLSPGHIDYKPVYKGDIWCRDGCYHRGAVWSYLMGAYIDALVYVHEEEGKKAAVTIVNEFLEHLNEAGVGTISEIFDGEFPHTPRGCIAQAWGVGEILRVAMKYNLFAVPQEAQVSHALH